MDQNYENSSLSDHELRLIAYAEMLLPMAEEREALENSLRAFVKVAWNKFDSSEYADSWALDAICDHLQAVTEGHIRRLLINIPPRCGKTNLCSIIWPAWTWARQAKAFTSGPGVRFLSGSYDAKLSLRNAVLSRRLMMSDWYQERWGDRFRLRDDQNTKGQYDNDKGGVRFSTSVGGSLLGVGGDVSVIDDPHNLEGVESDAERETTRDWWREVSATRLNNPRLSALVVIMQRLHMEDTSGVIMKSEDYRDWTHLMIPMRHDKARHCVTTLRRDQVGIPSKAWQDPRKAEGELMWPERFGPTEVGKMERELGPYMAAGRLAQNPEPPGGGIIKREWWQPWTQKGYPEFSHCAAFLDTAYTAKEQNDPSALVIWGIFPEPKTGAPKAMLVYAWEGRLQFPELIETVATICGKSSIKSDLPSYPVDRLIIEAKASGISVAQQLRTVYGASQNFGVEELTPDKWGDKIARTYAVQHMFADKMIYAPMNGPDPKNPKPKKFAALVIDQMAAFPYAAHDDLTDAAGIGLLYLRAMGYLQRREEHAADVAESITYRPKLAPLY